MNRRVAILYICALASVLSGARAVSDDFRPLPFFYDLYTFRGGQGRTTVVASIAVEAGRLERERVDGHSRYRFDVRFVLADTARKSVTNTEDSVFLSRSSPLSGQHLLHTHVEVLARPSTTTLQRVILTDATRPGTGQLYTSPFPIPDYGGSDLMLSDIAFGLPGASTGWTRDGVTLALLPTSQFPEGSFDVYYEIYNLPAGSEYETEISIEALDDSERRGQPVRMLFSGEASTRVDDSVRELRHVESGLERGRYRFRVTVRDLTTGRAATRSRPLRVRGWTRGATLVPALPYRNGTPRA